MLQAGGSSPVFYGGKISTINAAPRVSLATVTGDDIIGDCTFSATQARRDRINQVIPNYRSEDHDWSVIPGSAVVVSSFVTMDGDERTKEVNYPLVQNVHQASQLACYEIYNSREAGPGKIQLKPFYLNYRPGDCVTFAPESGASIKVEITGRELDPTSGAVTLDVRGETDAKHAFALAQTGTAPPISSIVYDNSVAAPGVSDWSLSGTTLAANNTATPALVVTGALSNPNADGIIFEYRLHASGLGDDANWIGAGTETPTTIRKEIVSVTPSTSYDVSVRYRVRGVLSDRRIIGPATSGNGVIDWSAVGNAAGTRPADNATNTTTYTGSTQPSFPRIGDSWNDTSTNPATLKIRVTTGWVIAASNVTNTNQVIDGANLGKTATGLDPVTGVVTNRVPSNLIGIGSAGNIYLDPNFTDQTLITVIPAASGNIVFVTPTQLITPAGVATADISSAADLTTLGVSKATKSFGGTGVSGRFRSPYYQIPGAGTFTGSMRMLFKAGGNYTGSLGMTFYDRNFAQLTQVSATIGYTGLGSDTLQDVVATGASPVGAQYVAFNPNITSTVSPFYMALPIIRSVATPGFVSLDDTTNLVPDGSFLDAATTWRLPAQWSVVANSTAGEGAGVNKLIISTAGASVGASTDYVSAPPGKSVLCSYYAKDTANVDSSYVLVGMYAYNAAKGFLSQQYQVVRPTSNVGRVQTVYVTPANTAFIRYFIATSGSGANAFEISEPIMRFASVSGDNLIAQNGTTVLNDTSIVTGIGYSAGIFGQGRGATANSLTDLSPTEGGKLSGIATGATNTTTYSGSTAPASPQNGDTWADSSTTPATIKLRVAGAWVTGATNTTDTNQLNDSANLGKSATWNFVIGAGKPADGATVGAIAGTNLKDSGGTVVNDNGFLNQHVTVDPTTGQLINIGTTGVVVDNSKQSMDTLTDGTTFKKISGSWVSGGKAVINFADTIHTNKNLATIDGAANTKLSGIATGATVGATWGTNVTGQPTNLSGINATEGSKLGGVQTGADVTATNQVSVTYTTGKTIPADYLGTIPTGGLPTTIPAPKVTVGGVDMTQSNNVSYAIVSGSDTGGCSGNITVDSTNGSGVKGLQTIGIGFNASGGYQLQITVNGYALPVIGVTVTKKLADPPAGGGGGGGSGATSASMSTGGYAAYSTTFAWVGSVLTNITVASGKTAYCSGGDDYSVLGGSSLLGNVTLKVKWQYSPTGAGTWTDMGTAVNGSSATYNNKTGDEAAGSVSCAMSVAPSAAAYDFRLMAAINSGSTGASGQFVGSGSWGVNVT
jgi:hypothetical protein